LCVLDRDVPVPLVQHPGVLELELHLGPVPPAVLLDESLVRKGLLRIDVPPPHPRVRGRGVQEPPVLLGILAVVPLAPGEPGAQADTSITALTSSGPRSSASCHRSSGTRRVIRRSSHAPSALTRASAACS